MPTLPELQDAPLSVRAVNALSKAGYRTVAQCLNLTEAQLLAIDNIGKKTVREILAYLEEFRSGESNLSDETLIDSHDNSGHPKSEFVEYLKVVLALPVSEILFTVRVKNVFGYLKIKYLKDLVSLDRRQLLAQKNAGSKSLKEIIYFLNRLDLNLGMSLNLLLLEKVNGYIQGCEGDPVKLIENFKEAYPDRAGVLNEIRIRTIGSERMEFYNRCFELYKQGGTLEYVAKAVGLTRGRIQQILSKGTKYGLFEYKGHEYPYVSKEKLISDYKKYLRLPKMCEVNRISPTYLKRLFITYNITPKVLAQLKDEFHREDCLNGYNKIVAELGHHPTTTELQRKREWRYFETKIRKRWGSFDAFREYINIPIPKKGNPHFREHVKEWIEHKKQIALLKRMQRLDDIKDCLFSSGPLSSSEIAKHCGIPERQIWRHLQLLISTGEIKRVGAGVHTKYSI